MVSTSPINLNEHSFTSQFSGANLPFLNALSVGIVIQNAAGEIVECNTGSLEILGLTLEQLKGRSSFDKRWRSIHEDGTPFPGETHPAIVALNTGVEQCSVVMGVHKPSGELTWICINAHPIKNNCGRVTSCISSFADITPQVKTREIIEASETRKQAILSATNESFFLIDSGYRFIEINAAARQLIRQVYHREVNEGLCIFDLIAPEQVEAVKAYIDEAFGGVTTDYDYTVQTGQGISWFQIAYKPAFQHGSINAVCVTITDISTRQQAVEEVKQREQQLTSLSDHIPGAMYEFIYHADGSYGFGYLSPVIEKIFGIPVADFKSSLSHIFPDDREELQKKILLSGRNKQPFYFEGRLVDAAGRIRWHSASSSFSYEAENRDITYTGILIDITDRKIAEQEKFAYESRFRLTLDKIGDNAWEHNFKTNETTFSTSAFELIGRDKENIKSNAAIWWESVHDEDKWMLIESDRKYKTGEQENHVLQYRLLHKNGSFKWILDRGVVFERSAHGKIVRVVGTHTDITHEKEIQAILMQNELENKRKIVRAVIEAQEREREQISIELHENFNQILSSCKMMLSVASMKDKTDKAILKEVARHIDGVIGESRGIAQQLRNSMIEQVGLTGVITDLVQQVQDLGKVTVSLDTSSFDDSLAVDTDIKLTVYRIIQEQLKNVIRHSVASHVSVQLSLNEKQLSVLVRDDGKGFNMEAGHTGLGFVNISSRIQYYGGKMDIVSRPGEGCSMRFSIPIQK